MTNPNSSPELLRRIRTSMAMLQQHAEGCATNHYGNDFALHGLPRWLADTKADLERLTDLVALSQTPPTPSLSTDVQSAATGCHEHDVSLKVAMPAPGEAEAVCAQCKGMRDDLASGRDPEELCDPCYDDAVANLATVAAGDDEGVARGIEAAAAWHDAESAKAKDSEWAAQKLGFWERLAHHQKLAAFHSSSAAAIRLLSQGEGE